MTEPGNTIDPGPDTERRGSWPLAIIAAGGFALLYLGFLSSQYNLDGTVFAFWLGEAVHSGDTGKLWHPRHLLYLPAAYVFFKAIAAAGIDVGYVTALQLFDCMAAAVTLAAFQVLCFRLTRDRAVSFIATLLLGASFGFWYFAIEPHVYGPHCLALIVGFWLAWQLTAPGPGLAWAARAVLLGLMGALVMLIHISSGLFLLPLGWAALWYVRAPAAPGVGGRIRAGIAPAIMTSGLALLIALLVYWIGYNQNPLAEGQGLIDWVRGSFNPHTGMGYRDTYLVLSPAAVTRGARGFVRTFIALDDYLLSGGGISTATGIAAAAGIFLCLLAYLLRLPRLINDDRRTQSLLLLALVPAGAFSMLWDPVHIRLKTPLLHLIWLAAAMGVSRFLRDRKTRSGRMAVIALLLAVVAAMGYHNFAGAIRPGSDPANNLDLERAYFVRDHTEPEAVVYLSGEGGYNRGKIYLVYFGGRRTRVVDWILARDKRPFPAPLVAAFSADQDRPAYVLSELAEPGPVLDRLARAHNLDPARLLAVIRSAGPKKTAEMDDGFGIYRLTFPPPESPR